MQERDLIPDTLTLEQYLQQKGDSQTDLAARLEVTQGAISQWANHVTKPRFQRCKEIFRETGCLVTGQEWYPDERAYFEALVAEARRPRRSAPAAGEGAACH